MAGSTEDSMQNIMDNMVSNTTTTHDELEEIEPFSGVIDIEIVREMIESDPFIREAIDFLTEHLRSRNGEDQDQN